MSLRRSGALLLSLTIGGACITIASSASAQGAAPAPAPAPAKSADPKKPSAPAAPPATSTPPPASPAPNAAPEAKPADPPAADKEDKRAIYVSADIGFTRADLGGIKDNTGFDKTAANGYLAGIGLGYRFKDFRIGARFRDTITTQFSLRSLMGELGYGLAFRPVTPVLFVHVGYMYDTGVERSVIASQLPKGNVLTPNVDLEGLVVGGELTASYWLTKFLRIGPFIGVDFTFLHRAQANLPQSIVPIDQDTKQKPLFSDGGSGVGYMLTIGLRGTGDISF